MGDVDGDGDLDLVEGVSRQSERKSNRLYRNNGTPNPFTDVEGIEIIGREERTTSIALADIDGDGDLDIVEGNDQDRNRMYTNNSSPNPFSDINAMDLANDVQISNSIAVGDVNNDGYLDIVVGNVFPNPNKLYLNNKTSTPFQGVFGTRISNDAYGTYAIALGDVNNDGYLDVVAGTSRFSPSRLYLNTPNEETFENVDGVSITDDENHTNSIALGDVDGDGDLDIIMGNDETLLFQVDSLLESDFNQLDAGIVPDSILKEFEDVNIFISDPITVVARNPGEEWQIVESDKNIFNLERDSPSLTVHDGTNRMYPIKEQRYT